MTDWEKKAAAKRAQRDALLPHDTLLPHDALPPTDLDVLAVPSRSGILSPQELEITDSQSITVLLDRIKDRTYSAEQVVRAFCRRAAIAQQLLDHWNATEAVTGSGRPVDAVLCPVSATAPQILRGRQYYGYTAWCNLADYPSAVVPVTRVDQVKDPKVAREGYHNDLDRELWEMYDPEVYKNAPIGVQIVGQKDEDEAVIRMAEIVDAALKASRA
ncbi:hypothetical protein CspHIS471_0211900 [Cutaneotrichosporon sp. HIS471]|nr:hypothetical protein CspHIS471_0211900 [Cutaneotrichosporon sp. HIS471]